MLGNSLKDWVKRPGKRALLLVMALLIFYGVGRFVVAKEEPLGQIRVGSKNFTESVIIAELYAQALEREGYSVARLFNLGGTLIAHTALQNGQIDVYPEYTGTGLLDVLRQPTERDFETVFTILNREYQRRWDLRWLKPATANDSQGLVVTRNTAEAYDLYTLSRLAKLAPGLRLAAIPEFEERADGLRGLHNAYGGFQFKTVQLYENGLKYTVLRQGQADVVVGFTTESALTDPELVLLNDDRHFWPAYRVAPVVRNVAVTRYPRLSGALNAVSEKLDTATLQRLNARVELEHQDTQRVAAEFLKGVR